MHPWSPNDIKAACAEAAAYLCYVGGFASGALGMGYGLRHQQPTVAVVGITGMVALRKAGDAFHAYACKRASYVCGPQ